MYSPTLRRAPEGLGLPFEQILTDFILPVGATVGGALATRLITGPSTPSQKDIEAQMKLQTQLEIQRMMAAEQSTSDLAKSLLPVGAVVLGLVLLLR